MKTIVETYTEFTNKKVIKKLHFTIKDFNTSNVKSFEKMINNINDFKYLFDFESTCFVQLTTKEKEVNDKINFLLAKLKSKKIKYYLTISDVIIDNK